MTETTIPNGLPQLAVGSYEKGAGKACIMNAISYLNGDKDISDMPDCVDELLSIAAQKVNDLICPVAHRDQLDPDRLCLKCSHRMWMIGSWLIGTGEVERKLSTDPLALQKIRVATVLQFRDWVIERNPESVTVATGRPPADMVLRLLNDVYISTRNSFYVDVSEAMREALMALVNIFYEVSGMNQQPHEWTDEEYETVVTEAKIPVTK